MTGRLAGKRALVTAAAQGIGRATALAFAHEGAEVLATDINIELLREIDGPGIRTAGLDVTDAGAIDRLVGANDPFAILFNCAGFVHHGTLLEATDEEWQFAFNLNVTAMFHMMRAVLPGMQQLGSGSIINMASVASSLKGAPNRFVYGATKAAVIGMTKSVAADFVAGNIRCNAICPGTVATPSLDDRINALPDPVQGRVDFIARQPMGRLGEPGEIAQLAVYLAADESAFVTGTTQVIDGGWST